MWTHVVSQQQTVKWQTRFVLVVMPSDTKEKAPNTTPKLYLQINKKMQEQMHSTEAHWEDAAKHSYKQNGFFFSDTQEQLYFHVTYTMSVSKKQDIFALEIIYLPTTFIVSAISLTPFSMTVSLSVIT